MTFSFGSTSAPATGGFGAAASTPAFGAPAASAAPAFGASTQQPSAFGGFGKPAATTASTGFGGFGAPASTANTGFGGFGSTATTTQSTGFGGFGATAATTAQSTGFGGFGTAASTPNTGFGGFGAAASTANAGFGGFGAAAKTTASAFGGFGTGTTSTASAFGGFGASTSQPAAGGFGGFGGTSSASTGFGGFGATSNTTGFGANTTFGAPQQQQQQQQQSGVGQSSGDAALYQSVMQCQLFNDNRDSIIARLNMLQASWGQGKAYYSNQAQPHTITQDNPLCRFKSVGYSMIPKYENTDGLVALVINKKVGEVEAGKTQLITSLTGVLGNKPGLSVSVENIKESGDNSEVIVTVTENNNGVIRKIPSQDLNTFFTNQAMQLKNLGVQNVYSKIGFSKSDLEDYLKTAPSGVDARLWKQAVADNPDPGKFIPVPLIGFKSLQSRITAQEAQNKAHCGRLDTLAEEIHALKKKQADACAALTEAKRKQVELAHRVLRVLVQQESTRKVGFTLAREEEQLMSQLESVAAELATPTQFRGRLHELLSCVRLQSQGMQGSGGERYTLDPGAVSDIRDVLGEQQRGIQALMQLVKDDFRDLDVIVKKIKSE